MAKSSREVSDLPPPVNLKDGFGSSSLVAQMVKNPPATQETWVQFLGWEDPLEEGMATHSSILAWRIPMDRGAWWARSPWGRKESDATEPLTFSFLFQNQEKQLI